MISSTAAKARNEIGVGLSKPQAVDVSRPNYNDNVDICDGMLPTTH